MNDFVVLVKTVMVLNIFCVILFGIIIVALLRDKS